ncbi:hypothetical protein CQA18_27755, partial [Enterobacter hormaechei]|uniref:hypothetical protein n=1 Tax=Enterobacter hormaechei TaxID=158836 RepID=UPI000BDA65FE
VLTQLFVSAKTGRRENRLFLSMAVVITVGAVVLVDVLTQLFVSAKTGRRENRLFLSMAVVITVGAVV